MKRACRKTLSSELFGIQVAMHAGRQARARWVAWLAAILIALGGGFPAVPALAAPVVQTADASIAGTYQSDVLPAPDSTGLVVSLTLDEDGSAELMSDYLNDEAPIVEVGEWAQNADGTVTLTVTGTAEQEYSQPIELTFQVDEAGALVIPGEPNGPFGEDGLVLAPTELPVATAEEGATTEAPVVDLAGLPDNALVYRSEVLPSASTSGLQITLILFADGTLEMVSDYQEPGQVVLELGTWAAADDGTVIVTLTGQLDRNYEAPVELAFTTTDDGALSLVDEDGLLFGEDGLTLTPLVGEGEATTEEAPAEATVELPEATPTALPEAETEAEVAADVEVEAPITATETLTVEVTPAPEATPVPTETVTPTEEATDDAVEEAAPATDETVMDDTVVGEAIPGETADAAMMVGVPDGAFVSALLPAADASGFFQVAVFYPNGDLMLSSYFLNGEPPVVEIGRWEVSADVVTDTVDAGATEPVTEPVTDTVTETVPVTVPVTDTGAMTETSASAPLTYTVTLTGTVEEVYENPVIIQMIAQTGGALELDTVTLYPLPTAKLDTMTPVAVAQFESDVLPAASGPGLQIRLTLYDDASLEMMSDFQEPGEVVTETGEWLVNDEGNLVVTLTGQGDQPYEEPVTLIFAIGEDDTLTLIDDEGLFGDAGLTLLSVPVEPNATDGDAEEATGFGVVEEDAEPTDEPLVEPGDEADEEADVPGEPLPAQLGVYQSEVLPSASSPGLQVSVTLLEDDAVAVEYDYLNNEEVVTQVGTWQDNGDGTVTVTLTEGPSGVFDEPVVLTLAVGEGSVTVVEADEDNAGLIDVELAYLPLE